MNSNKTISDNKLIELFGEIPFDEPASEFMENLLLRLEKEVVRKKRKDLLILVGQIAAGLFGILILPALAIYLCTIFLSGYSFSFPKIHIDFEFNLIVIGFAVLLLLILDLLFRMYAANRTKRNSHFNG